MTRRSAAQASLVLAAILLAVVLMTATALTGCATTGGARLSLPFGPGKTGDEDARIGAELFALGAIFSSTAAVDAGLLRGAKRDKARALFPKGVQALSALRAADAAANAPQLAAQAAAVGFVFLEVQQLVATGTPKAPAAGADPAPSATAAILAAAALAPEAVGWANEARHAFAAKDEATKRAFIDRISARNDLLIAETRARIEGG